MGKVKQKQKKASKVETGEMSKVKRKRAEVVREEILAAEKQVEDGYLDAAELLGEAYHNEFYKEWGFPNFEVYCNEELSLGYRKCKYLVDVWDKVKSLDLPKERVAALGWTKMKDIAQVIDRTNAIEWLAKAEKMSSRELEEAVKIVRKKDTSGTKVPTVVTMTIRMEEAEANIITGAIEEAKKLCESEDVSVALEMICQDWLMEKGATPERTPLEATIKYLEKVYGIDIEYEAKRKGTKTKKEEAEEILEEAAGEEGDEDADIDSILGISDS